MKNVTYINAGAGSGKTYTLTETLSEVIAQGKVRPDEVILATFTNLAANEFKEKAKAKLFEHGLFEEANLLDGSAIGTIHSVAYSIISKFWYDLGLPPSPNIMTDDDGVIYRNQSLGALPSTEELRKLHEFAEFFDIKADTNAKQCDYNFWQSQLEKIIGFSTNHEITDFTESREKSKAFFQQFVRPGFSAPTDQEIDAAITALGEIFAMQKDSGKNTERKKILKELRRNFRVRRNMKFYKDLKDLGNAIKATKEDPAVKVVNDKLALIWLSEMVYNRVAEYIDIMFDIASRWKEQYAEFKKRMNILDFNDLEKYLLQLLKTPAAAEQIGKQYRYIFVDEFQDCSPIQVKIFDALSELAEQSYWVGDMKQSIYGFRGSDTQLTDAVVKSIEAKTSEPGYQTKTLEYSWRSVPEIVNFCNGLFTEAFAPDIPTEKVTLKPQKNSNNEIKPLIFWNVANEKEEIANHIVKLFDEGVDPKDIAVLDRRGKAGEDLGPTLAKYGIKVNMSTEPIMTSKVARLVTALLNYIDNETDSLAKGEVAFILDERYNTATLISETLAHVDPESGKPNHAFLDEIPILRRASEIRNRLNQQSVAGLVESAILELNLYEEAKKCAEETEVNNVLTTIINAAKTYEEVATRLNTAPTIKGFTDYLDGGTVLCPGDPEGVNLMTMHKAKGLEWKHVIITSLSSNPANENKAVKLDVFGVHFRRETEPCDKCLFPKVYIALLPFIYGSGNTNAPTEIADMIKNQEEFHRILKNKISEETRLLYVAMTRPSDQLILSLKDKTPLRWITDMNVPDLNSANMLAARGFVDDGKADEPEQPFVTPIDYTCSVEDHEQTERRDYSPSMINGTSEVIAHHDFMKRIPMTKLPEDMDMNIVGNCVHHIFRMCNDSALADERMQTLIQSYGLQSVLCDRPEIAAAWGRLQEYIRSEHGEIKGYGHERPFILHREGKIFTGSVDLTVETDAGLVLIDYKTCPMGNSALLDPTNKHFAGLYGGQLDAYTAALETAGEKVIRKYIYYPISGIIITLK